MASANLLKSMEAIEKRDGSSSVAFQVFEIFYTAAIRGVAMEEGTTYLPTSIIMALGRLKLRLPISQRGEVDRLAQDARHEFIRPELVASRDPIELPVTIVLSDPAWHLEQWDQENIDPLCPICRQSLGGHMTIFVQDMANNTHEIHYTCHSWPRIDS